MTNEHFQKDNEQKTRMNAQTRSFFSIPVHGSVCVCVDLTPCRTILSEKRHEKKKKISNGTKQAKRDSRR